PNWFPCHAAEHRACRQAVALFDQSSFAKFLFRGPDACRALQWICGNDVDVPIGKVVYTGLFNSRGTFESDLTVVRLAEDQYYIVTATSQAVHDADWIRKNVRASQHAELIDVTTGFAVLGLMGPRSRELLGTLTEADLSNSTSPFGTCRQISIGPTIVQAL